MGGRRVDARRERNRRLTTRRLAAAHGAGGVAAWKNSMSTVATAGQRGADWPNATLAGRGRAGAQAIGSGWWLEKKMKGLWFGGWSRAGLVLSQPRADLD